MESPDEFRRLEIIILNRTELPCCDKHRDEFISWFASLETNIVHSAEIPPAIQVCDHCLIILADYLDTQDIRSGVNDKINILLKVIEFRRVEFEEREALNREVFAEIMIPMKGAENFIKHYGGLQHSDGSLDFSHGKWGEIIETLSRALSTNVFTKNNRILIGPMNMNSLNNAREILSIYGLVVSEMEKKGI